MKNSTKLIQDLKKYNNVTALKIYRMNSMSAACMHAAYIIIVCILGNTALFSITKLSLVKPNS